jgi:peptide/nickel transport system ATP-binding protein
MTDLLSVRDLGVAYANGAVMAVDGADLTVPHGGMLGLVGESGCGKTTLARALMGVLPPGARITRGSVVLDGTDLVALSPAARREKLWRELAFVPQTAMSALDPVYRLRDQMREVLCDRGGLGRAEADARAAALFEAVGLHPRRLADYPHQFSGGMRQRAAIALALALRPKLVIADEPVTALDVIVQRQVLDTFRSLGAEMGLSCVIVTHDISVVAYLCGHVAVMYAGKVVEHGPTEAVLERPSHPYTMGLMNAFPDLESDEAVLAPIEGSPPPLSDPPPGCRFAPRCPFAEARCRTLQPPPVTLSADHWAACHRVAEAPALRAAARRPVTWQGVAEVAA